MGPSREHNHSPATGAPAEMAMCPVMNLPVNKQEARVHGLERKHAGEDYFLCCDTCATQFDNDPGKFTDDGTPHAH